MQRLLIGFGSVVFLIVIAILVVPFFLPKDQIKQQVIAQIDNRFGWGLRLDGPVSLSLFPGFSLVADDIGLSGEAGADGIEFAKAERVQFGLAWGGLISGNIQVTEIGLVKPDIYLEIDKAGITSWEPRRDFVTGSAEQDVQPAAPATSGNSASDSDAPSHGSAQGYLKSIGVDRLEIADGTVTYRDANSGQNLAVKDFSLTVRAPDLAGDVDLDAAFVFQEIPLAITGKLSNPLGLAAGEQVPVDLALSSGENRVTLTGSGGMTPPRADIAVNAEGPSLKALAGLAGVDLKAEPGAYTLETNVKASAAAAAISGLQVSLGELSIGGAADLDLSGLVPELTGRLALKDGSVGDLLLLAGQDLPASGRLSADLAFESAGLKAEELIAGLDLNGSVSIVDGEVGGLGLAPAVGGDLEADRITDLTMTVNLQGLQKPVSLNGAMAWRGEGFTLTGQANTAAFLAGQAAPLSVSVKGNRFSAGFDGQADRTGKLDGAVRVETADLRGLMAWMGQPLGSGGGLKTFKASGIFGMQGETLSFEETRFTLDDTSGEANGRVDLSGKPKVTAKLALRELVLDPYLDGAGNGGQAGGVQTSSADGSGSGSASVAAASPPAPAASPAWSIAPIDFSGLGAVDVDFEMTAQAIRWDEIKIGRSALTTKIQDGVMTASLDKVSLYNGSGKGTVTLNGAASLPAVAAQFTLSELDAFPLLRDAADFGWIEGKAAITLDVKSRGASEQQLVQGLDGSASYEFSDGAIRGINIPQMVRGLSVETLLGWQENPSAKTDFSSLSASFDIQNGVAKTDDLSLVGPLVRMSGTGTTDMPAQTLSWRVEPRIVASLEGQPPTPRRKGEAKKMAGLGVPIVIEGSWNDPKIYPDIAGILSDPEAAYKQLQETGGELISILKGQNASPENLADTANQVIQQVTGGNTQIDVQKVIEGDVDDEQVLKAVEEGFGLPSGLLGNILGGGQKQDN